MLRPYQEAIRDDVYAAWKAGAKNVLLVMPTGMGKTRTFCAITIDVAIKAVFGHNWATAIMVHRKELVQQICLTLAEQGIAHNIIAPRPVIMGIVAAERLEHKKSFYDYNAPVTVVSVDTLNARIEKHRKWADKIQLWIIDEAAHVLRENKWGRACGYFKNARGLGVTATPERLDKRGLGSHADGVFDVMVEGPTSRWGIDHGFLCPYKVVIPDSDYRLYLKAAAGDSDFTKEAMAVASQRSHIVGDAVKNYAKFAAGKQCIVFASDIGTGKRLEAEYVAAGFPAKLLTGETPDAERLKALIEYREKKIKVLINVDLFDEGLDVPGIEVVQMCRPTMSKGKFLQMCGRGLRPAEGKPYLILMDHVGNIGNSQNPGHGLPDTPRRWTLDRIVKRRARVNLIRICSNPACNSPFDRIAHECPFCGTSDHPSSGGGGGGGRLSPKTVDGDLVMLDPQTIRELEAQTQLEAPADVARRVGAAAGPAAAKKAMHAQQERIKTQKELVDTIAVFAGKMRDRGYTDRQINKYFYAHFDMTLWEAISMPRESMLETMQELKSGHM